MRIAQHAVPRRALNDTPSLIALLVAEMHIALVTHWLTGTFVRKSELVAATPITNTRTLLASQFPDARTRTG